MVPFKIFRGKKQDLPSIIEEGNFYVITDQKKLYMDVNNHRVPINQFTQLDIVNIVQNNTLHQSDVNTLIDAKMITEDEINTLIDAKMITEAEINALIDARIATKRKYLHILTRYNVDALDYPMGWTAIITKNATETYDSIAEWLNTNNYTSLQKSYSFTGGATGTATVTTPTGTTSYVGRPASGIFSEDGVTIKFKADYNASSTIIKERTIISSYALID